MEERFKLEIGFYESLAKLFYTVLICDNSIHKNELNNLEAALRSDFIIAEKDNVYSSDEGLILLKKKLGDLIVSNASSIIAFDEFKAFYTNNIVLFTEAIKIKLWQVINSLSYSSAGKNKAEVIILHEVTQLFSHKKQSI